MKAMKSKKGFTLIELMVVVIIVGILAAVAVPLMSANAEKAKNSEAVAALGSISTAARLYIVENGAAPADLDALVAAGLFNLTDLDGTYYDSAAGYDSAAFAVDGRVDSATLDDSDGNNWTYTWDGDSYESIKN